MRLTQTSYYDYCQRQDDYDEQQHQHYRFMIITTTESERKVSEPFGMLTEIVDILLPVNGQTLLVDETSPYLDWIPIRYGLCSVVLSWLVLELLSVWCP